MKNECDIVKDLLPLYAEGLVREETADFVKGHLQGCEECRKELEKAETSILGREEEAAMLPLQALRRKLRMGKIKAAALAAVFAAALLVSAFAFLSSPTYFPYSEGLVRPKGLGDAGVLLTFGEEVTDFRYSLSKDPEGGEFYVCEIEAWTSLWDRWFSGGTGNRSFLLPARESKPIFLVYLPNDGSESVCIGRYDPSVDPCIEENADWERGIALPRLSLGYYFLLAAGALALSAVLWAALRKKERARAVVECVGLYPLAYLLSHGIVAGIHWTTYSLPRDFSLLLFLSFLLYSGLLLVRSLLYLRREMRDGGR